MLSCTPHPTLYWTPPSPSPAPDSARWGPHPRRRPVAAHGRILGLHPEHQCGRGRAPLRGGVPALHGWVHAAHGCCGPRHHPVLPLEVPARPTCRVVVNRRAADHAPPTARAQSCSPARTHWARRGWCHESTSSRSSTRAHATHCRGFGIVDADPYGCNRKRLTPMEPMGETSAVSKAKDVSPSSDA